MNVIIIDSDSDFRTQVVRELEARLPEALIMEYDPISHGAPSSDFDWSVYDVLVLGANNGDRTVGWPWITIGVRADQFPGVILLSQAGDDEISEQAAEIDAVEFLSKREAKGSALAELVISARHNRAKYGRSPQSKVRTRAAPVLANEIVQPQEAESVPGYQLLDLLGEGVRSKVYLARAVSDAALVAVKILKQESLDHDDMLPRFIQEAELLASARSPHVVAIREQGFTDESGFMAMEYLPGGSLRRRMAFGLPRGDVVRYARALAHGVAAIHAAGIVHRDLHPANVLFRLDDTPVISDFGWSKSDSVDLDLTGTGQLVGMPQYVSPEQALGDEVDGRTDLYSLGTIFYEMLEGKPPFTGKTAAVVLRRQLNEEVPSMHSDPGPWQKIIPRLLAREPDRRCASARELIAVLDSAF